MAPPPSCEGSAGERERAGEAAAVRAAQRGDEQAFGQLIEPHLDRAYRLALRLLGTPEDAEDAVQNALYRAWRALPRFRGDARFATWLYRIVCRSCLDHARLRQRTSVAPFEEAIAERAGSAADPQAALEHRLTQEAVIRALARLPLPYRAVIALFYIEDLPLKEVAKILELPLGTVKTHLHRARRALRAELGDDAEGGTP